MVSLLHEGVIKLVRDRPAFAAEMLGDLLKLRVPDFRRARLADVSLNELVPAQYWADAVIVFSKRKPVFGVIVEAQLEPDKDKRFTWPLYAVGARARTRAMPICGSRGDAEGVNGQVGGQADRPGWRESVPAARRGA